MSEEAATEAEASEPGEDGVWARETAPQSPYSMRQVGIGLVVLAIGAAVAFGVPLALA